MLDPIVLGIDLEKSIKRRQTLATTLASTPFYFRHFPQLDGLRGLAILLVVVDHTLYFQFGVHTDLGKLGVGLFFVLSGFLITGLLDSELLVTGTVSLTAFYSRRALRLFPALFVFLGILCLLIERKVVRDTPFYTVGACLVYVRNIFGRGSSTAHIWSLSLEEQFYLCWPFVLKFFKRSVSLWIAICSTAAITVFRMLAIWLNWFDYRTGVFFERAWFRFDSLLLGCVVVLWVLQAKYAGRLWAVVAHGTAPFILWPCTLAWTIWGDATSHACYLTGQMGLATLIVANLVLSTESHYLALFCHPASRWLGRISYSWYLWHYLFLETGSAGSKLWTLFLLASSLAAAIASYYIVEKPFLKLKDRLGQSSNRRTMTCEAAA